MIYYWSYLVAFCKGHLVFFLLFDSFEFKISSNVKMWSTIKSFLTWYCKATHNVPDFWYIYCTTILFPKMMLMSKLYDLIKNWLQLNYRKWFDFNEHAWYTLYKIKMYKNCSDYFELHIQLLFDWFLSKIIIKQYAYV